MTARARQAAEAEEAPSAQTRLQAIDGKLKELQRSREALTARLAPTDREAQVEAVLQGRDVDDLVKSTHEQVASIDQKTEILRKAAKELSERAQAEAQRAGAAQRDRLREGVGHALKQYVAGLETAHEALRGIQGLNAELRKRGVGAFEVPTFKRLALPGWDRDMVTFGRALERAGFAPETCGVPMPRARQAAPRVLPPEVQRALAERVQTITLHSDMP